MGARRAEALGLATVMLVRALRAKDMLAGWLLGVGSVGLCPAELVAFAEEAHCEGSHSPFTHRGFGWWGVQELLCCWTAATRLRAPMHASGPSAARLNQCHTERQGWGVPSPLHLQLLLLLQQLPLLLRLTLRLPQRLVLHERSPPLRRHVPELAQQPRLLRGEGVRVGAAALLGAHA